MAMICKICNNKDRLKIDQAIVQGGNLSKISKEFKVPYTSLYNHAQEHISRQLSQAWEKKQLDQDFDMLHRIDTLVKRAEDIFKRNYDKGKDIIALKAIGEQRSTFELLAKISYSLHQAKLAEIEIARQETGQHKEEERIDFGRRLKILTIEELKVLQQIETKLRMQNPNIKCLSKKQLLDGGFTDGYTKADIFIHPKTNDEIQAVTTPETDDFDDGTDQEETFELKYEQRPIKSKDIPSEESDRF